MADSFQDFIASERTRLNGEREAIFNQQQELEHKLEAINVELRAIEAYEAAKSGKAASAAMRGTRSRRGRNHGAAASVNCCWS